MKTENVRLWLTVALILRGVPLAEIPAAVEQLKDVADSESDWLPFTPNPDASEEPEKENQRSTEPLPL